MIKFLKKNKGIAAGLFILNIIVCLAVLASPAAERALRCQRFYGL